LEPSLGAAVRLSTLIKFGSDASPLATDLVAKIPGSARPLDLDRRAL
jgi:hypothetical protein